MTPVIEEYQEGMLNVRELQCKSCKHYRGLRGNAFRCTAYPIEIPVMILSGAWDHHNPYPGDGGITFEPLPTKYNHNPEGGS